MEMGYYLFGGVVACNIHCICTLSFDRRCVVSRWDNCVVRHFRSDSAVGNRLNNRCGRCRRNDWICNRIVDSVDGNLGEKERNVVMIVRHSSFEINIHELS